MVEGQKRVGVKHGQGERWVGVPVAERDGGRLSSTNTGPPQPKLSAPRYSVGVDLGQASDYTAVAILGKEPAPPRSAAVPPDGNDDGVVEGRHVYDLVYMKRPKLGTPYDTIAEKVIDRVLSLEPRGAFGEVGQVFLSVDGTGVGRGVVDMLRSELYERYQRGEQECIVHFRAVSVTGSNTTLKRPESRNGYWSVPKKDLVFPAVAAFQQSRIRIGKVADRDALVHELRNYSRRTNIATGNQVFEPWREADHDDLLFALCLALWGFELPARTFWQQVG